MIMRGEVRRRNWGKSISLLFVLVGSLRYLLINENGEEIPGSCAKYPCSSMADPCVELSGKYDHNDIACINK